MKPLSRRRLLRGLGTVLALPLLEAMLPPKHLDDAVSGELPVRLVFCSLPNGVTMGHWTPRAAGTDFELPDILAPLAPHREYLTILSGLAHGQARDVGAVGGDHARSGAVYLTGCRAYKTEGADIHLGISVDQVAAQHLGAQTRFPSLELGTEASTQVGVTDKGYSNAYTSNISWRSATTPVAKETDPQRVFDRLFSAGESAEAARARFERRRDQTSVLDYVLEDARRLGSDLGTHDRGKVDEYFTSVREVERRLNAGSRPAPLPPPGSTRPKRFTAAQGWAAVVEVPRPRGTFAEQSRLMLDVLTLAFQTDQTRIASFMFDTELSGRAYHELGITEGFHAISHHRNDPERKAMLTRINRYHAEQFAHFLDRLRGTQEGPGNLLDRTLVLYGGAISDGNIHRNDNLPALLAGKAGGLLKPGRHIRYPADTPMCNLFLSLLHGVGVDVPRFGDSSGELPRLT